MRKEKKSSGIYLAVFIALIMILSVIGFMTTREEKQAYGKFSFSEKNNQWSTKTQNGELLSYYLPQDVEQIAVPEQAKSLILNTKMLYITYDPKDEDVETLATAQYSLGLALEQLGVY
ncbi:hypothetical protein KY308_04480, partial [Candidatus Woesearchaeota archaeon]|nr:hypothetical protein [Candidatus Woesearchaeota archaeon]